MKCPSPPPSRDSPPGWAYLFPRRAATAFERGNKLGHPRFKKGASGNPKGRPPTSNSIAALIREKTKGGQWIVERAYQLASQSKDENLALRALEFMAGYGFLKPSQEAENNPNTAVNLLALIDAARAERGLDA